MRSNIKNKFHVPSLEEVAESFKDPGLTKLAILGSIVGVIGGLGAVFFYYLILGFKYLFYGATDTDGFLDVLWGLPWYYRLLVPAIGGLIIGPIIHYVVPEARGHGVPEVMEAVSLKEGNIRPLVAPLKALMSAICIGSGGAAGREGPIVQIGSSFGSALGQYLKLTPEDKKALLAAGAAAGIAGTFNAPLAGIIFSIEVILRKVKLDNFAPVVLGSVVGYSVANFIFLQILGRPRGAIFSIPEFYIASYWEVFTYLGLGLVAGLVALFYTNLLYGFEDVFEYIPIPGFIKPGIGGLGIGILAVLGLPHIMATGYPVMDAALFGELALSMLILLMFAKIIATSLTLGSGGSGGIFAPGLFIGSMLGGAYGRILNIISPGAVASPSSYGLVAMGAIFAGATHAPLAGILIIFEMTMDLNVFIPLIFACMVSTVVASHIQKSNIYTIKLLRRGVDVDKAQGGVELENLRVKDHMTTDLVTVNINTSVSRARELGKEYDYTNLPVVEERTGEVVGVVSYSEKMDAISEGYEHIAVRSVMEPLSVTITQDEHLLDALKLMMEKDVNLIPVVPEKGSKKLLGVLTRVDIINAYKEENEDTGDIEAIEDIPDSEK